MVWLIDEKGVDPNQPCGYADMTPLRFAKTTPLHCASFAAKVDALLARGADPAVLDRYGKTPLMHIARDGKVACVARLLQDPRARSVVNAALSTSRSTALHYACSKDATDRARMIQLLLQAGADPTITSYQGLTALQLLQCNDPTNLPALDLLSPQTYAAHLRSDFLVHARRLVVAATNGGRATWAQARLGQDNALPLVVPLNVYLQGEEGNRRRKLRKTLSFVVGLDGPGGKTLPGGVFVHMMTMLMPTWDPLRKAF